MRRSVWTRVAAIAGAAGLIFGGGGAAAASTETRTGKQTYDVVQLGDSYSAGNGAGAYYGDPEARTSHNNYAEVYARWLSAQPGMFVRYTSYAHSGYTSTDVLNNQILQVPFDTDLVLFTIGGNDVDFQDIVRYCFLVGSRASSDCREHVDAANAAIPQVRTNTEKILQQLSDRLGPDAEIILVGYPQLSTDTDYSLCDWTVLCWGSHSYDAAEAVRDLGDAAAKMQSDLVAAWNERPGVARVYHAGGVAAHFAGHEPEPHFGEHNAKRWINEFWQTEGVQDGDKDTDSSWSADRMNWYHPNITGHAQVAAVIQGDIGMTPGAKIIQAANLAAGAPAVRTMAAPAAVRAMAAAGNGPDAWLHGPFVQAVGSSIAFDARASVAGAGELTSFEWDVDGDGTIDAVTTDPTYTHTFTAPFDGQVRVRVTQTDGARATAATDVVISADGDATEESSDNCPDVANHSQSDEDGDGIGDECDETSGHATADRPGVHVVTDGGLSREGADPHDGQTVPANTEGTSVLAPGSVAAGATVPVSASGFVPGDVAEVWLHSDPVLVGTATVGADGSVSTRVTVPAGTDPGAHRIYVVAPAMFASAPVTVTAAPGGSGGAGEGAADSGGARNQAPADTAAPAGSRPLATTGAEAPLWLLTLGATALIGGLALVLRRHRARS